MLPSVSGEDRQGHGDGPASWPALVHKEDLTTRGVRKVSSRPGKSLGKGNQCEQAKDPGTALMLPECTVYVKK